MTDTLPLSTLPQDLADRAGRMGVRQMVDETLEAFETRLVSVEDAGRALRRQREACRAVDPVADAVEVVEQPAWAKRLYQLELRGWAIYRKIGTIRTTHHPALPRLFRQIEAIDRLIEKHRRQA